MSESEARSEPGSVDQSEGAVLPDRAVTAVTYDGAFRVIVVRAGGLAQEIVDRQRAQGPNAGHLVDLVTGALLVRLTMAPFFRVQGILRSADGGTLVADTWPGGATRGLLQLPEGVAQISVDPRAQLMTMRALPRGQAHRSVVPFPEGGGVSEALMSYMSTSEQITSVVAVHHLRDGDRILGAGGYLVQLLPEVSRAPLEVMTARLEADFADRDEVVRALTADPTDLLAELLHRMPFEQTQEEELRFGCQCSRVRVLSSLTTLPKEELASLAESEESLSIDCDYCGEVYAISPRELRGLLEPS